VIDPGVLISALITPSGVTAGVLDLVEGERITVVVSPHLLDELAEVLHREKFVRYLTPGQADQFVSELRERVEITADPDQLPPVSRDPVDDYLVALARNADADALISGDADLTSLALADLPILTPRGFLDRLANED
jgi:putative PIN family toxin of toxin-antitoxin system